MPSTICADPMPEAVSFLTRVIAAECASEILELLTLLNKTSAEDRKNGLQLCNPEAYARSLYASLMTAELTPQEVHDCITLWSGEFAGSLHAFLAECCRLVWLMAPRRDMSTFPPKHEVSHD